VVKDAIEGSPKVGEDSMPLRESISTMPRFQLSGFGSNSLMMGSGNVRKIMNFNEFVVGEMSRPVARTFWLNSIGSAPNALSRPGPIS
jgi:hypothetical protein